MKLMNEWRLWWRRKWLWGVWGCGLNNCHLPGYPNVRDSSMFALLHHLKILFDAIIMIKCCILIYRYTSSITPSPTFRGRLICEFRILSILLGLEKGGRLIRESAYMRRYTVLLYCMVHPTMFLDPLIVRLIFLYILLLGMLRINTRNQTT